MTDIPTRGAVLAARNADMAVFGANGFAFASWMSRVPDVKDALALTAGELGIVLLAISLGAVLGLPAAGRIAHALGSAGTVRLGMFVAMPGLVWAALAVEWHASMVLVMVGLFCMGLGTGIWDVAQNLQGTIVERALARAIMPWFHAAFSFGTVLGALVGAAIVALRVPVGVHLICVALITVALLWWGSARFLDAPEERAEGQAAAATGPVRSAWTEPRTLIVGLMVTAAAFTEGTANDWMAVAFVEGHGVDNALGVVSLAVFLSFMTAGRLLGTGLLDRYGRVATLRVLFLAAIVGCLMVVFGNVWVAFLGTALWGLAASLGFPVGMSAAADDPARAAMRVSVVSTIGYTAFLAGPPVLGFLGDQVGVLRALLAVGVVSLLALLAVPQARPLSETRAR